MKKPTDGPDWIAIEELRERQKEKERLERLALIAEGKHINKYKS